MGRIDLGEEAVRDPRRLGQRATRSKQEHRIGAVVATLEAVKLFLSVPKMAFVLAADDALVMLALAQSAYVIEGGRVVYHGTAAELRDHQR